MKFKQGGPGNAGSLLLCLLAVLVIADFLSRSLCFALCANSVRFFSFGLHPFPNYHFAFSAPVPVSVMYGFYILAICALGAYLITRWQEFDFSLKFLWGLIFVGAVANVVDRLAFGYVRDFIQIGSGYFNLADVYILFGVGGILLVSRRTLSR